MLALASCGEERLLESESQLVDDLVVTFYLEPDTTRTGEQIQALLGISNPGSETVHLESVEGCPAELAIQDPAGAAVAFGGADTCEVWAPELGWVIPADTSTTIELIPGDDPFWTQWDLAATVEDPSSPGTTRPPVPGLYTVRLVTPSPFPTLETHLRVLGSQAARARAPGGDDE